MNILIRTDIGGIHGLGHASRMLSLARELQRLRASVTFVTATEALRDYVHPFLCYLRHEYIALMPNIYIIDTKASDESNDNGILAQMRDRKPVSPFDSSRRPGVERLRIVRIDHPHASPDSCDLLIAPGNHWDPVTVSRLRLLFGDRLLYGWEYVLLDPTVTDRAPIPYQEREQGPVVFCAGGSDPSGALQQMYDATQDIDLQGRTTVFLEGSHAQPLDRGPSQVLRTSQIITTFDPDWIREAAFLVTTFGHTCYEALWWQVPQIVFGHTEENIYGAQWLSYATGTALYAASLAQNHILHSYLPYYMRNPPVRSRMAENAATYALLDGQSLTRIATAILEG